MQQAVEPYRPVNRIRVVTAASLFDGHDAAINIMRRILQSSGAEVIHLGHNRSVREIVTAAIQEDVQAIGLSCYQGGHIEFFKYLVDLLRENDAEHIRVFGGGGGVIVPEEIRELEAYGVTKIYSPEDGQKVGLQGIINHFLQTSDFPASDGNLNGDLSGLDTLQWKLIAHTITSVEVAKESENGNLPAIMSVLEEKARGRKVPVLGVTGTGGAGKSSLVDELVLRFLGDQKDKTVGIISVDPTRRKTGGALLGDRIRMNSIYSDRVYYRSLATRSLGLEIPIHLQEAISVLKGAGFDLIVVETAGIGQGDAAVVPLADVSLYVMTSDFGAQTQLEKCGLSWTTKLEARPDKKPSSQTIIIPTERSGYLSEIAETVRKYHSWGKQQEELTRRLWQLDATAKALRAKGLPVDSEALTNIKELQEEVERELDPRALRLV